MKLLSANELIETLRHYPPDAKISLKDGTIFANDAPVAKQKDLDEHGFGYFEHPHWTRYRVALVSEHGQVKVKALSPPDEKHKGFLRWISPEEEVAFSS